MCMTKCEFHHGVYFSRNFTNAAWSFYLMHIVHMLQHGGWLVHDDEDSNQLVSKGIISRMKKIIRQSLWIIHVGKHAPKPSRRVTYVSQRSDHIPWLMYLLQSKLMVEDNWSSLLVLLQSELMVEDNWSPVWWL